MYLGKTLAVIGTAYIAIHIVSGAWTCYNEFCPGDNEADWVYEYTDEDGKRYLVADGEPVLIEDTK